MGILIGVLASLAAMRCRNKRERRLRERQSLALEALD
jgi:hypothetical protein